MENVNWNHLYVPTKQLDGYRNYGRESEDGGTQYLARRKGATHKWSWKQRTHNYHFHPIMEVCPSSMDPESVDATLALLDASAAYSRPR